MDRKELASMTYGGDGSHWAGCEDVHWDCAILWLEARRDEHRCGDSPSRRPPGLRNSPLLATGPVPKAINIAEWE